jgi:hypothetical protein
VLTTFLHWGKASFIQILFVFILTQNDTNFRQISDERAIAIALGNIDPITDKRIGYLSDFAVSLLLI